MEQIEGLVVDILEKHPKAAKLILNPASVMGLFIRYKQYDIFDLNKCHGCLLKNDKALIGWAWAFNERNPNNNVVHFMLYINPLFRKKGYGKILYNWGRQFAKKQHRPMRFYPWDNRSTNFYHSVNANFKHSKPCL